jgi:hypothetical protein
VGSVATHAGPPPRMHDVKERSSVAFAGVQGTGAMPSTDISALLDALMKGDRAGEAAAGHGITTKDLKGLLQEATGLITYA